MREFKLDNIPTKSFDSSSAVLSYISDNLIKPDYEFVFRGQRDEGWDLEPTISRYIEKNRKVFNLDYSDYEHLRKSVEFRLLKTFKDNVRRNQDIAEERIDTVDLWQLGQHHGLPTPLLDWTRSPYVGLFFAICGNAITNDDKVQGRALWVLNLTILREINYSIEKNIWPKVSKYMREVQIPKMELIETFDSENRRIVYQQGVFTKHVHYKSFQVWIKRITDEISHDIWSEPILTKIVIPGDLKIRNELMMILDKMNINYRTLFPDLYGSATDAAENVIQRLSGNRYNHISSKQSAEKSEQIKRKKSNNRVQ